MRATRIVLLVLAGVAVMSAGCKKNAVDARAFKSALNSYYAGQQNCLFTAPIKFPAQADTPGCVSHKEFRRIEVRDTKHRVTVVFDTKFANKEVAEVVTTVHEPDGKWRVTGYSAQ